MTESPLVFNGVLAQKSQVSSTDFWPRPLCTCIDLFMILGTIDDGYSKPSQFYVEHYSIFFRLANLYLNSASLR